MVAPLLNDTWLRTVVDYIGKIVSDVCRYLFNYKAVSGLALPLHALYTKPMAGSRLEVDPSWVYLGKI